MLSSSRYRICSQTGAIAPYGRNLAVHLQDMGRRVARFLALAPADRRLLALAVIVQPLVRLALRLMGFRRCHLVLRRLVPIATRLVGTSRAPLEEATRAAQLVHSAGFHGLLDCGCLTQSLTLWWLLRRRGIDSEIYIGVRKIGNMLEAHAWVEYSGTVISDHPEIGRRFAPLTSISTSNLDKSGFITPGCSPGLQAWGRAAHIRSPKGLSYETRGRRRAVHETASNVDHLKAS